jgi:hypothetical protein
MIVNNAQEVSTSGEHEDNLRISVAINNDQF